MNPFLKQVASFYEASPELQQTVFVFPNRRSMVFFRKYLGEVMRERGVSAPRLSPVLLPINDFFYRVYNVDITDRNRLLVELYHCYKTLYPKAEPLDEFIFWGDVILSDFDDVDKYLVNAEQLFANVADFKGMQDGFSYLTDTQREAVEHFMAHFRDRAGHLIVGAGDEANVKSRFLQIWDLLYPLYRDFKARLRERGMAYEGMVYRALSEQMLSGLPARDVLKDTFPRESRYVFVGLNALNACERLLLSKMRDAGLAEFCWDYVSDMIRHPLNKSSLFMEENVRDFPQAFQPDPEGLPVPRFEVVRVASSVGQAKLVPEILREALPGDPVETAFVLPDGNLLMPLLNSLPPEVDSVNVTMGYPMAGGAVYALMEAVGAMQLKLREHGGKWYFYHRPVEAVLSSSLLRKVLTPEEKEVLARVKAAGRYYIPAEDLGGGPLLDLVFRPVVTRPKDADAGQNLLLCNYFREIVSQIGWLLRPQGDMLLELDFAKRYFMVLNVLRDQQLEVLPSTWLRILDRMLSVEAVPFRGEPLEGLQIMGPLETRALDFKNLVILSANEGMFPRRSSTSSFIPPELRKGFDLPTFEYQDAVWAYYFYRMIQRAGKVFLVYDSRTEGLKTGEESRYIKQLEYHFRVPVHRRTAFSRIEAVPGEGEIPKTPEDIALIREKELSASVLQSYLACPAKFYYQVVRGLRSEEEVAESLDAGMLGNVYHKTMQELYSGRETVSAAYLDGLLKDRPALKGTVRKYILEEMHSIEVAGRNLVLEEIITDYVDKTLRYDRKLLADSGSAGFRILGLERRMTAHFHGFRLKGFVDRMDSYLPGEVRIVDYKTGKVEDADISITDENAAAVVEKLFGTQNKGRPKIALQLFIYDLFAQADPSLQGGRIVNSIYSATRLFSEPLKDHALSGEFCRLARERLQGLLDEMTDPGVPFRRTEELTTCSYCDFKMICGR